MLVRPGRVKPGLATLCLPDRISPKDSTIDQAFFTSALLTFGLVVLHGGEVPRAVACPAASSVTTRKSSDAVTCSLGQKLPLIENLCQR